MPVAMMGVEVTTHQSIGGRKGVSSYKDAQRPRVNVASLDTPYNRSNNRDPNFGSDFCIPSYCQTYGGYHWFNLNSIHSKDLSAASTTSDPRDLS